MRLSFDVFDFKITNQAVFFYFLKKYVQFDFSVDNYFKIFIKVFDYQFFSSRGCFIFSPIKSFGFVFFVYRLSQIIDKNSDSNLHFIFLGNKLYLKHTYIKRCIQKKPLKKEKKQYFFIIVSSKKFEIFCC